jgi:ribonuclease HI
MSSSAVMRIHTDGASRGNPGAAAYAYTIERDGEEDIEEADCLGRMTNNQAEYTALVRALEHGLELGANYKVIVHSDSELMVKQFRGEYKVKDEDLRQLCEDARGLARRFAGGVELVHVRRAQNARADALCNEALDGKRQATPRASTVQAMKQAIAPPPPSATRPVPPASTTGLREDAIACLRKAASAWAGGVLEPTPERVWAQLAEVLIRHGVALPPGKRRNLR